MPPLLELCKDGKLAEVRAALARGENVNYKGYGGLTALMWAVLESHNSIVKLLLDQPGVKVNEKNNFYGLTALHFAVGRNDFFKNFRTQNHVHVVSRKTYWST